MGKESEKKVAIIDGKLTLCLVIPNEARKARERFAKEMTRQGSWMPETTMHQILDAYNESFEAEWVN